MMTDSTRTAADRYLRRAAPAVPYVAVLIGLYALSSAWASILGYHAGIVVVLTATGSWVALRTAARCRRVLVMVTAGAALVGPAIYAGWSLTKRSGLELAEELAELGLVDHWWILFMLYYFTVNPVLEELFWRGYLGSPAAGPQWGDVLFAGYHVLVIVKFVSTPWVAGGVAALVLAAWFWRQVARECEGLLIPVLSHAVADASLIAAVFFLAR